MPSKSNVVRMLRDDLEAAGIDYQDAAGKFCDFHSLRHTTGSMLAAAGVSPKVAQSIMRHSTIELTLGRYSHIYKGQETDAIAALPDLSRPSQAAQQAKATGTDDIIPLETPAKILAKSLAKNCGKIGILANIDGQIAENQDCSKAAFSSEKHGFSAKNGKKGNWAEADLNRRHMDFQSIALPTELSTRLNSFGCIV